MSYRFTELSPEIATSNCTLYMSLNNDNKKASRCKNKNPNKCHIYTTKEDFPLLTFKTFINLSLLTIFLGFY